MRKPLLLALALGMSALPAPAQTLYWELPARKAPSGVSYSGSAANDEFLALSWQERSGTGAASSVSIYLDTARLDAPDTDTRWTGRRLLHGPIALAGVGEEPRMHAIAMDDRRILAAIVLPSATGTEGSEVLIKSSEDGGSTFREIARFTAETVVTSPDLSRTADGGWLLMMTQPEEIEGEGAQATQGKLSIAFCTSSDGERWSDLKPMVTEPTLTQNIQPHHVVMGKTDYVVFQSKRVTNHLYLKTSSDGGRSWTGKSIPITSGEGFAEAAAGKARTPEDFNNQRPYLIPLGDRLGLAWERALVGSDLTQVYYCEIDPEGRVILPKEPVSQGGSALYPQLLPIAGTTRLLYAEKQLGQMRLMLATRAAGGGAGGWSASVIPSIDTGTLVPHGAVMKDRLFVFAEVRSSTNDWALYAIRPDTSAPAPALRPLDFSPGTPTSRSTVTVDWSEPADPSRIESYRYTWGREGAPVNQATLAGASQQLVLDAPTDGVWKLAVWARDRAGNTSIAPATVTFVRDATPPGAVTMFLQPAPLLDGYQPSNDFTITWTASARRRHRSLRRVGPPVGRRRQRRTPGRKPAGREHRQRRVHGEGVRGRSGRQCRPAGRDDPPPESLPAGYLHCARRRARRQRGEPRHPAHRSGFLVGRRGDGGVPRPRRASTLRQHAHARRPEVRGSRRPPRHGHHPGIRLRKRRVPRRGASSRARRPFRGAGGRLPGSRHGEDRGLQPPLGTPVGRRAHVPMVRSIPCHADRRGSRPRRRPARRLIAPARGDCPRRRRAQSGGARPPGRTPGADHRRGDRTETQSAASPGYRPALEVLLPGQRAGDRDRCRRGGPAGSPDDLAGTADSRRSTAEPIESTPRLRGGPCGVIPGCRSLRIRHRVERPRLDRRHAAGRALGGALPHHHGTECPTFGGPGRPGLPLGDER